MSQIWIKNSLNLTFFAFCGIIIVEKVKKGDFYD